MHDQLLLIRKSQIFLIATASRASHVGSGAAFFLRTKHVKISERIMRHTGYFSTPEEVDMGNQIVPRPDKYYLFLETKKVLGFFS